MKNDPVLVIFGASGDLAGRKLIPAFTSLFKSGSVGKKTRILGVGRTELSDGEFRGLTDFSGRDKAFFYQQVDTEDPLSYVRLKERLANS